MAIIKRIVHVLAILVYILVSLYAIICLPILFGYNPLVVLTGSMEPTYKEGSIIYYKKVNIEDLKVGDPITFVNQSGNYVSHRINSIDGNLYETKGDANNAVDPIKVDASKIKGRDAKVSIPYAGLFVQYINEHLIIVMIVAIIILLSEFLFSNIGTLDIKKVEKGE